MNIQKAVEVLKLLRKSIKQGGELPTIFKEHTKAIDTVVEHCEQKTYTAKDMQSFLSWAINNGWSYGELTELWYNDEEDLEGLIIDDVLKLWEEAK